MTPVRFPTAAAAAAAVDGSPSLFEVSFVSRRRRATDDCDSVFSLRFECDGSPPPRRGEVRCAYRLDGDGILLLKMMYNWLDYCGDVASQLHRRFGATINSFELK